MLGVINNVAIIFSGFPNRHKLPASAPRDIISPNFPKISASAAQLSPRPDTTTQIRTIPKPSTQSISETSLPTILLQYFPNTSSTPSSDTAPGSASTFESKPGRTDRIGSQEGKALW